MKRTVPLLITAIVGFVLIVSFFIPEYQEWGEITAVWFDILAAIAFILGGGNLIKVHLKKISDRTRGWGYSAVTIFAFVATLYIGLFKVGSPPAANTEFYGETFAQLTLNLMPEYREAGTIPDRADGEPLPASVRSSIKQDGNEVVFKGWMSSNQKEDLLGYDDTLEWKCLVERLHKQAQPPEDLENDVNYYVDHGQLAYTGSMSDADRTLLLAEFEGKPVVESAIAQLYEASKKATQSDQVTIPSAVATAAGSADEPVTIEDSRMTVRGPMTPELRKKLASEWSGFPRARPMNESARDALIAEIEERGSALTDDPDSDLDQVGALNKYLNTIWTVESLRLALVAAGQPKEIPKTACEMLAEMQDGVAEIAPQKLVGEEVEFGAEQVALLEQFAVDASMSVEELTEQLQAAGEFTDEQSKTLTEFIQMTPTVAEVKRNLALELMKVGPLTREQHAYLTDDYRVQYQWEQAVGSLFMASQQEKYPWSGEYNAQGNPFWWVYSYVFQPLTATMFAMLAFYVASAAFRAFRAKNVEAVLLLGTAFLILLGRTFAGYMMTAWLPDWLSGLRIDQLTVYVMGVFNTAGNRAIMIGIALGIASTSLKVLLGVDRSYLGSGDD